MMHDQIHIKSDTHLIPQTASNSDTHQSSRYLIYRYRVLDDRRASQRMFNRNQLQKFKKQCIAYTIFTIKKFNLLKQYFTSVESK